MACTILCCLSVTVRSLQYAAGKALQGAEYVVSAVPVQVTYSEILSYKEHIPEGVPVTQLTPHLASPQHAPDGATTAR